MKKIGYLVKIFVVTLFILMALLYLVWLIPERAVVGHMNEAVQLIKEHEDEWEEHFTYAWGAKLDNTTDMVMLRRVVSTADKNESIIYKALYCNNYARYWHGYLIILRPLLAIMSYVQIRYLYMVIHMAALVGIALKIEKRFGRTIVYGWVVSMMAVNFVSLPFSLQYSWVFFIMYGAIYYIDRCYEKGMSRDRNHDFLGVFLVIGMLTSFMDLLTAPLVTLGIPMIYLLLLRMRLEQETGCKRNIALTIKASAVWAIGYIGCWAVKWVLASPILKQNVLSNAVSQIGVRMKGNFNGGGGRTYSGIVV